MDSLINDAKTLNTTHSYENKIRIIPAEVTNENINQCIIPEFCNV